LRALFDSSGCLISRPIKDEEANSRRQIAVPPIRVDFGDKVRYSLIALVRDLLQRTPERIFEAHAGPMATDSNRALYDR